MTQTTVRRLGVAALLVLPLLTSGCAWIARASVDTTGGDANSGSEQPAISADGRYVAFVSSANDLVPEDGTGPPEGFDVFVRDLRTRVTTRASVDTAGGDPDAPSGQVSISADGRYVAFLSSATDLVSSDGNGFSDVFVRDLQLGITVRVSLDQAGGDLDGNSLWASISADGRSVAFASEATDLVSDDGNGFSDVFVRDLQTGTTTRASVGMSGGDADGTSDRPSISADGRYVAFQSNAFFVPEYGGCLCVYVRDLQQGVTIGVPQDFNEIENQFGPSISADGRHVAFNSHVINKGQFVYVHDLQTGLTRQVSVDIDGGDPDDISAGPSLSGDGRYVAFHSEASDLVMGGTHTFEVYVRDMQTDTTLRASASPLGVPSGFATFPSLSADGRYIAFVSRSDKLAGPEPSGFDDVFVRAVILPTIDAVNPTTIARGSTETFSLTGANFAPDAFVWAGTASGLESGVTVDSVTVVSDTQLEVSITVAADVAMEALQIFVINPGPGPGRVRGSAGLCDPCPTIT